MTLMSARVVKSCVIVLLALAWAAAGTALGAPLTFGPRSSNEATGRPFPATNDDSSAESSAENGSSSFGGSTGDSAVRDGQRSFLTSSSDGISESGWLTNLAPQDGDSSSAPAKSRKGSTRLWVPATSGTNQVPIGYGVQQPPTLTYMPFFDVPSFLDFVMGGDGHSNGYYGAGFGSDDGGGTNFTTISHVGSSGGLLSFDSQGTITVPPPQAIVAVPEPATLALLGLGLAGVGALRSRRQKRA